MTMNPWNEVILKPELGPNTNLNGGGGGMQNNLMYNENDNGSLIMMGGNGPNGVPNGSHNNTAAVAAAVATAMMMSHQNGGNPNNMILGNGQRLPGNMNPNMSQMGSNMNISDDQDDDDTMDNDDDDDCGSVNNDAEGVWSPDIEQSFQEALAIYPPCGRRKIILSEEGKMYGRNELIARYIKVRTGKTRSRKQVSSHIQVLAKRKTKDFHNHLKDGKDGKVLNGFPNPFSNLTSAQIISPSTIPLQTQQQNLINPNGLPAQNQLIQNNQSLQQQQQQLQQQMRNGMPQGHHQPHHQSQLLQNCTNILPNNMNGQQSASIWSHPGLQKLMPSSSSVPSSTSSNQLNDDLTPSSSASSSSSNSSQNQENRHAHHGHHHHHHNHHHTQLSPDSSPRSANQLWSMYSNTNSLYKKCVIGLHQLRLIEFSGFLEKRRDPEIYHKHLFVHLNTSDFSPSYGNGLTSANTSPSSGNGPVSLTGQSATSSSTSSSSSGSANGTSANGPSNTNGDAGGEFECINYKEFADKFPENDLIWSTSSDKPSAYLIKFWVDLNYTLEDNVSSLYAVNNIFESPESMTVSCSTKVCSFGNQVVEKVETERASYESNGRYVYKFENSPMCEYMITFINKLKQLPEKSLKNSVLENFSVLQSIKNHDTNKLLLTLAYVFEVSTSEHGAQHVIYRLVNK